MTMRYVGGGHKKKYRVIDLKRNKFGVPAIVIIGIRKKLILSHSYDHRIINGSVGSSFVKRVAEYLEKWDISQTI